MNKYDFPTSKNYTKENVLRVQQTLLKMAKEVHTVLEKNNIKYFITFGTLLGAIRHKGFIPWDDDFDIFLFDEDYEKAIHHLKSNLPDWLVVHNEFSDSMYWASWSKIRDVNSETNATLYPNDNKHKYRGICLDLYRLKKIARKDVTTETIKENIAYYLRKRKLKLINKKQGLRIILRLLMIYVAEKFKSILSNQENEVFSFVILLNEIEVSSVFPLKIYDFEDTKFWGPSKPDILLQRAYGEYMRIPDFEDRKSHYDEVIFKDTIDS